MYIYIYIYVQTDRPTARGRPKPLEWWTKYLGHAWSGTPEDRAGAYKEESEGGGGQPASGRVPYWKGDLLTGPSQVAFNAKTLMLVTCCGMPVTLSWAPWPSKLRRNLLGACANTQMQLLVRLCVCYLYSFRDKWNKALFHDCQESIQGHQDPKLLEVEEPST